MLKLFADSGYQAPEFRNALAKIVLHQMFPILQPVPAPPQITLERVLLGLTRIARFDYD
jgi:hypothetical protein